MKRQQTHGPTAATTGEIASVIDHDFYCERARRLRAEALAGGVRDFVYRTVTRFTARPASRLPLRPRYSYRSGERSLDF